MASEKTVQPKIPGELDGPESVAFEVPGSQEGAINVNGFALHIALFPSMFSYGLRLPFPRPIRDVLDHLKLAPS